MVIWKVKSLRPRGFLPCLNSNISTEIASTQHRKAASALGWNVFALAQKHGLENLGFLTLTFKDHVLDVKEAQRRLNSLLTHIIKPRYQDYIGVLERQKSGRIHYHLLVVIGFDIPPGSTSPESKPRTTAAPTLPFGLSGRSGARPLRPMASGVPN